MNAFLSPLPWGLGVTYTVHFRVIGKLNFLRDLLHKTLNIKHDVLVGYMRSFNFDFVQFFSCNLAVTVIYRVRTHSRVVMP